MSAWQNRYQRLLFDRPHPKVLRVTMNRPDKYNATDAIMHTELVNVWRDIDGDDTVNCVIIQGAGGKVFSAGGDFDLIENNMKDYNALLRTWKEARDIVYNVINCSKPIVSTMRGPAVGAGLVAGILADVSIASKKAKIIDGHTRAGLKMPRPDYSAWDLSADQANATRRMLVHYAVDASQIERVAGYADTVPLPGEKPGSEANHRVTLSLSMKSKARDAQRPTPEVKPAAKIMSLGSGANSNHSK